MKVLAIGNESARNLAAEIYGPEAQIESTRVGPDKKQSGYNSVLAYMVLNTVPIKKVKDVLQTWIAALKDHGEIVIIVPSLEWVAMQILNSKPDPAYLRVLYGAQEKPDEYNRSGFTMLELRAIAAHLGIAVTHASTGEFVIGDSVAECHTIRGIKK